MCVQPLRALRCNVDGSALVEGAVLLPLLFVLLFGVYEFSWYFYQQHLVSTGLRDAARYLARVNSPCDANSPVWPIEEAYAKNLATTGSIAGGAARVKGWTAGMVALRCTAIDNPGAYRGGEVIHVITASSRFSDPSLGFFALLRLPPPAISAAHSERAIGPG
jgi:Flp pilus assembly protein TadG